MVEFPAKRVKMKRSRKVKTVGSWSVINYTNLLAAMST